MKASINVSNFLQMHSNSAHDDSFQYDDLFNLNRVSFLFVI